MILIAVLSKAMQGSKIALVRSYLRVPQAAGQVKILIFLVKFIFFPYMQIVFVMQGKCLFSDISRPAMILIVVLSRAMILIAVLSKAMILIAV